MGFIFENIDEYNPNIKCKTLIVIELFSRGRKLNISCFYYKCYFVLPKSIRLSSTHYFIMKSPNKQEFNLFNLIFCVVLTLKTL